jgi:hypothetical protein
MTPLGALVEPEVYCKNARLSPEMEGSRHSFSRPAGRSSVASQRTAPRPGACANIPSTLESTAVVVIVTTAPASATMDWIRGRFRLLRGG